MKNIFKIAMTVGALAFATAVHSDSSVSSSVSDIKSHAPDYATMSICKTSTHTRVLQGKTLQPSNACRVINFWINDKFVGAVSIPLGTPFVVPWAPYKL